MYDFEQFKNSRAYIKINSTWQFHEVMWACEQAGLVWVNGGEKPTKFTPDYIYKVNNCEIYLTTWDGKHITWGMSIPNSGYELLPLKSEVEKFDEVLVYLDKELGWRTQSVKHFDGENKDKMIRDVKFLEQLMVSRVSELIRGGK